LAGILLMLSLIAALPGGLHEGRSDGLSVTSSLKQLVARAADATCFDIRGDGQQVLYGVAYNSGILAFADPYQPSVAYRGCARDMGTYYQLEGWGWDTNLGWVSLYCPGGSGAQNQGVDCGTYAYGVTVDKDDGQFHGFAWGDNIGYISFNCADDSTGCTGGNTHLVKAEVDSDCLGYIYSSTSFPTPNNCPAHTAVDAFAWSDSVGWLDLSGIIIPMGTGIIGIDPMTGPISGGTTVTITGSNFAGTPVVKFDGVDATDVQLVNSTTITAVTPSHALGYVDVSVTTLNGTDVLSNGFRYTCATGASEQCVEANVTGTITLEVPNDVTFPVLNASNLDQSNFSYGASGYALNVNDLLSVYDSRNSGGFKVQAHVTTPFETADHSKFIPLNNFFIATTSADTGGFRFAPPADDGIEYYSEPSTACNGSPMDVTPVSPWPPTSSSIGAVLTNPASFAGQNLGTGYNNYITYDLMDCDLSSGGRINIFRQNVNYYIKLAGGQQVGSYAVTITFDLVI